MTSHAEGLRLAARGQGVPAAGPAAAVGPVGERVVGESSPASSGASPLADAVFRRTDAHWDFGTGVPRPRSSAGLSWWFCGSCGGSDFVIRYWQFHERPGSPTIPWRCDVSIKCADCAVLSVHGVAVPLSVWLARPRHTTGLRRWLMRGSSFEPKLWNTGAARRG